MVEHATENRGVHSSILCLGTLGQYERPRCGRSTVVVRLLAKEKVVGSNPIARSVVLWRRGQVVRQGSAKPLFRGSNPLDASSKFTSVDFGLTIDRRREAFFVLHSLVFSPKRQRESPDSSLNFKQTFS